LTINDLWEGAVKFYNEPVESVFLRYTFENIVDSLITDGSGLGNHGQLGANKGGTLPEVENGIAGNAIRFNGSSSYVKIPRMLLRFPMTISVWVKPGSLTETSTAGRQMIFYVSEPMGNDGYGPEPEIHLMRSEGNTFVFWANAGRQRIDLRHPIGQEGRWTHIAIVYDETSTMYINGEPVSSQTGIKPPLLGSFAERIYIGRPNVDYLRYFNGTLDEITFFNEALNAKEVKELFRMY
ncbi:MAG: LamG domain-containing protein, partial [Bacteroidales bacterium]|nr:LamG domain-containing protein [Bacteroidales bacterium]